MRTHSHPKLSPCRGAALALLTLTCAIAHAQSVGAAHMQAPAAAALRPAAIDHSDRAGAQNAAERGLAEYVQRKQRHAGRSRAQALAADGSDDLAQARITGGFEVYTIAPEDMLSGRGELRQMAKPSGVWRFFARVGEKPVGLVTVQRLEGRWQAVSFGGAGLAQELSTLMARHGRMAADGTGGVSAMHTMGSMGASGTTGTAGGMRFIRIHQAQTDLLEVTSPQDMQARYAPLASARHALGQALPRVAMAAPAEAAEPSGQTDAQSMRMSQPTPAAQAAKTAAPVLLDTYELLEPLRAAVKRGMGTQP